MNNLKKTDQEKVCLVLTGASSILGLGLLEHLNRAAPYQIFLVGADMDVLEALLDRLKPAWDTVLVPFQIGKKYDFSKIVGHFSQKTSGIDCYIDLFRSPGPSMPTAQITQTEAEQTFQDNVWGPFFLFQSILPMMRKKGQLIRPCYPLLEEVPAYKSLLASTNQAYRCLIKALQVEGGEIFSFVEPPIPLCDLPVYRHFFPGISDQKMTCFSDIYSLIIKELCLEERR